jgi:Tol biopolymer transport system component/serine/threonine protein kinase
VPSNSGKQPSSDRWQRIQALYERALECSETQRAQFLDEACGADEDVRREVESLLGYASEAQRVMEEDKVDAPGSRRDADVFPEGRELGSYKVLSLLGAGGMGKVYLAKDTRLGRTVAVKVLASDKVANAEQKRRFMQEARAASALNHPNIVTLYDISNDGGIDFLVMEYVEGQSLHKRIPRRGLPLREVLSYARQIVSALASAHAAGIVHRDIKPANVVVTGKGTIKVLDFGLAKLAEPVGPASLDRPTEVTRTQKGVVLGTAAYMSPEQASGKPIDARSDIFAVGVVLYEMLSGRRAFDRGTILATLGAVLYEDPPPLDEIVKTAPPELLRIVDRCLRKDPDRRIQTMADLKVALEELEEAPESARVPARPSKPARKPWLVWAAVALIILAAAGAFFFLTRRAAPIPAFSAVVKPLTSVNGWEVTPGWSPDGTMMAFSNNLNGNMDIFMMPTAGGEPRQLTNTPHDEVAPRWSPDFRYLAFAADRGPGAAVYLMPALGGAERELAATGLPSLERFADSLQVLGSTPWSPNSQELLYSRATSSGGTAIWRINVATRQQSQVTFPGAGEGDYNASWSFDGTRIAFERTGNGRNTLQVIPAGGGEAVVLSDQNTFGAFTWSAANDRILFISPRTGRLNMWEIDIDSRELRPITSGPNWDMFPIVSRGGRLAYVSFGHQVDLHSLQLEGTEDTRVTFHTGESFFPSFSPNGRRLVYQSDRTGNSEIWELDLDTKTERNLTDHASGDLAPDWSPDGKEIVFLSKRGDKYQVWIMDSEGGSPRLLANHTVPVPLEGWSNGAVAPRWSPDGRSIAFIAASDSGADLWVMDRDGSNARQILGSVLYFDWYDNQRIVFVRRGQNGLTQVHARNLASGEESLLLPDAAIELAVSRDRSKLLYTHAISHFNMNLWVLPLRPGPTGMPAPNGEPRQVTNGRSLWHVHKGTWSPDGKTIFYTQDADQGDIYTIENYR